MNSGTTCVRWPLICAALVVLSACSSGGNSTTSAAASEATSTPPSTTTAPAPLPIDAPGSLVTFAAGLDCVWEITEALRKHYTFG